MKRKFLFGKTWFFEDFLPEGSPFSTWGFVIEKVIYSGRSKFQKIEIFDTKEFGRVLVLDGMVQLSTKDEFVYHEMLIHPALFSHPDPKTVLVIGGGDGGALREICRHPVEEIFHCDIDKKVIEVSKKYLPSLSKEVFSDKRVRTFNEDASKFIKRYKNFFDIIIDDLTDPKGPSMALWTSKFYKDCMLALKEKGIFSSQTAYLNDKFAIKARKRIKRIFPFFKVHRAFVGCFPFDEHTFTLGSKKINFDKIRFRKIKKRYKKLGIKTRYYSPEIHLASGITPKIY